MYKIKPYSFRKAKELGVQIKPSTRAGKKIDVFKNGEYIISIGALGYGDYPTYLETEGEVFAKQRRRLYKIRHEKDRGVKGSAGWYADEILW
jgi:hypothetical protein